LVLEYCFTKSSELLNLPNIQILIFKNINLYFSNSHTINRYKFMFSNLPVTLERIIFVSNNSYAGSLKNEQACSFIKNNVKQHAKLPLGC
jgi:hypothetical protein